MLNPSVATAEIDDPTIRKCVGFATRYGFRDLAVVNLFAYRATDPRELVRVARFRTSGRMKEDRLPVIVGPENDAWIRKTVSEPSAFVIAAWGWPGKRWQVRAQAVRELLPAEVYCLGETNSGQPRHPLMLRYGTELHRWTP